VGKCEGTRAWGGGFRDRRLSLRRRSTHRLDRLSRAVPERPGSRGAQPGLCGHCARVVGPRSPDRPRRAAGVDRPGRWPIGSC